MPLLYKYLPPYDAKTGVSLASIVLNTMRVSASDPRGFNDPFEVRPWFDQERHDYAAQTTESFHSNALGVPSTLMAGQSMVRFPTERSPCFGEGCNKKFRDRVGKKFRVLCLGRNPKSVLMWGHYTRTYAGIVIGIDTDTPGFAQGLKPGGFPVNYSPDRSKTKLPLAFYENPDVESYDLTGKIVNLPGDYLISGGLHITYRDYWQQIEDAEMAALTTKAEDWHYEAEVRFIYDLLKHEKQLTFEENRYLVTFPPEALREIIVGFNAKVELVEEIVGLFRNGKVGKPKLFFAECHPNLYEVEKQECDDEYLLKYFKIVLPGMS